MPILVTSGEPAGIGPDICLELVDVDIPVVVLADKFMLAERAKQLGRSIVFADYQLGSTFKKRAGQLFVLHIPCNNRVIPGKLDVQNAAYVMQMLTMAIDLCLKKQFSAVVTAPVNKKIMNEAGIAFTGHTEYFAYRCQAEQVVMLLACDVMRVGLVTTHLPLREVPETITVPLIMDVVGCLHRSLQHDFSIKKPKILIAGLNPHAGEGGYLGREEIDIIIPAVQQLQLLGVDIQGPLPADTMFSQNNCKNCDVFVAMYHDQGLAVLKYAGFGSAVNITLGLPVIRTSVDHGTALELAGLGVASAKSLLEALTCAHRIAQAREQKA